VEKQVTTPEYYPLTLNSLTLACNQKNNRHPVTAYSETEVAQALETLREKNLTYVFHGSTSRVPKYKHVMPEVMHLSKPQMAVMCVLMLRGPQTVGELRGNGARLYEFSGLDEVEETLTSLANREPEALWYDCRGSRAKRKRGWRTSCLGKSMWRRSRRKFHMSPAVPEPPIEFQPLKLKWKH
jgi:uncharacterized protein YceH (UPF0502 family)